MINFDQTNQLFHLQTTETSLILQVLPSGILTVNHFGRKLPLGDYSYLMSDIKRASYVSDTDLIKDYKLEQLPQLFPAYGNTDLRTPAFEFSYEDGSRTTDLRYQSHVVIKGKEELKGLPSLRAQKDTESLKIILFDQLKEVEVSIIISVFVSENLFTQSVSVKNLSMNKIVIQRLMSLSLDFLDDQYEWLRLTGAWGRERHVKRSKLVQGFQGLESKRGASGHAENPFVALTTVGATETIGEVYAANFVYSGNFLANIDVDMHQNTRLQMGISPFDFAWQLDSDERFVSPEVVLVYSDQGVGKMSRIFHQAYRNCLMQSSHALKERPVLINNWEATYFDFNEEKILALADEAQAIGVELFVLDDGWFGHRDDDTSSLGDWWPYESKLGGSLETLAKKIKDKGLQFGLWFEPEMVSPNSRLYQAHPEWVIQCEGRLIQQSRQQYVLDLSNPDVCQYIIESLSAVLALGCIDYVKWDMNRNLTNLGSTFLPKEQQKEQAHRYILGLYSILATLTQRFPEILFESCAGGGGRFDPGMLYYMPQTWTSDDTDAVERLAIQQGTSLVYPSVSMGCHISETPNHQVGRQTPLKTRGIVAMQGNLGYEIDLLNCDNDEKAEMAEQIKTYKNKRRLIQFGELYRLNALEENNQFAWLYIADNHQTVTVSFVQVLAKANTVPKRLKLVGLEERANYQIDNSEITRTGAELMTVGLALSKVTHDYFSESWYLTKLLKGDE